MKFTSFAVNTIHIEKWLVVKRTICENQHLFPREIGPMFIMLPTQLRVRVVVFQTLISFVSNYAKM